MPLTVPTPDLEYEQVAPGVAALEMPVAVAVGPVIDDGGVPVGPAQLLSHGLLVFRRQAPGALSQVWDGDAKAWVDDPAPDLADTSTSPLAHDAERSRPWHGIVVAAGGVDGLGEPQFTKAVSGYPSYTFRAWFAGRSGATGLSSPSAPVTFAGVSDRNLMVLGPAEGERPDRATEARLLLRSQGLQVIGGLVVRRDGTGAEVTLSNAAGASVVLKPDGSVELRPAASRPVVVAGDLDVGRVTYLPAGGGAKKPLV